MDLVVRGATVYDGTGAAGIVADVVVSDGRVVAIGPGAADRVGDPARTVEAAGRVVTPGFVDLHTHSDLTLLSNGFGPSTIRQGVTTAVVGNCGLGMAPISPAADVDDVRTANGYLDRDPDLRVGWDSIGGYLDTIDTAGIAPNVATLTAHLPIRASVLGLGDQAPTSADLDAMAILLDDALADGAVGLSTGLVYAPLTYATHDELVRLGEVVAARDRLFAWHVKDYADDLLASVRQALSVASMTGVRTQISHLTCVGRRNHGSARLALALVDEARANGLDVGVDIYPYLAGNAPLQQLLPAWVQEGGAEVFQRRLRDRAVREQVAQEWRGNALGWDEIVICAVPPDADQSVVGRTVADLGGTEAALDVLAEHGGAVMMVAFGRSDDDLRAVLTHASAVVASDGMALDPEGPTGGGLPHPRAYGCFPRYLSTYGRDDLAAAVHRCTGKPAARAGLDRGVLRVGAPADLVVLDLDRLADIATYERPAQYPTGVDLVVVNGEVVVDEGRDTGARPGRALRV